MHTLLLRDDRPNRRFIISLFLGYLIVRILTSIEVLKFFTDPSERTHFFIDIFLQFIAGFLSYWLWAFTLTKIDKTKILNRILVPALSVGSVYLLKRVLLMYVSPLTRELTVLDFVIPYLSFLILIGTCEFLFPKFQNKMVVYLVAAITSNIVVSVFLGSFREGKLPFDISFELLIHDVLEVIFASFFLTLFGEKYFVPTNTDALKLNDLKSRISEKLAAFVPRQEIFDQLRMEFVDLKDKAIARVITKSIDLDDKLQAKTAN